MAAEPVREFAAAKINLCLHVTGRRPDGYHLLDSLVAFAAVGDVVFAEPAGELTLSVTGTEGAGLRAETDNLVLRAARTFGTAARLELWKDLPVASGIGGGSADAAATLRALSRLTGRALPDPGQVLNLGADVPVCLASRPSRMRGIGEDLSPLPDLPKTWLVLVNPRQSVPTPAVFAALCRRDNPEVPEIPPLGWKTATAMADWLKVNTRNDLEAAATTICPAIKAVLSALAKTEGCLLARMSGSGATCFGLFPSPETAHAAASRLNVGFPGWWVRETELQTGK